jgi:EAL domain-containing protein (putative c-di-GMP-specific phosphodiesterase class I)
VELEVTEGMIMEDLDHSVQTLRSIRAQGITIAIDDFGTGFSSFNYLAKLPLDTLKVDRSFVVDLSHAKERYSQISAIVKLAHSMRVKVVAEGVETLEQAELLRRLGCDEMQGFLFSRPIPCSVFESTYLHKEGVHSVASLCSQEFTQPSFG